MHTAPRFVVVAAPRGGRYIGNRAARGVANSRRGSGRSRSGPRPASTSCGKWAAALDAMTRELVVVSRQADRSLPGRTHEYLAQLFEGARVHGGGVSAGPLLQRMGAAPVDRLAVDPVVLPLLDGWYELTYSLFLEDGYTYFVSAVDGAVVHREAAFDTQSAVGIGAGFLGDMKKISTTPESGRFEARDRPPAGRGRDPRRRLRRGAARPVARAGAVSRPALDVERHRGRRRQRLGRRGGGRRPRTHGLAARGGMASV